jgi:signal transduction histidine kinase
MSIGLSSQWFAMAFQSRLKLRTSPFPLLFRLELILLSIVMAAALWIWIGKPSGLLVDSTALPSTIGCLMIFSAMGLVVPTKHRSKVLYLGLEFLLVFLILFRTRLPFSQLIFITIVIRNCGFFTGKSRSIATGLTFLFNLICQFEILRRPLFSSLSSPEQMVVVGFVSMITFILVVPFIELFVDAILKEQESRRELAIAHAKLQQYALQIEDLATVQERNRIAREIHDSLGHSLSIFNLHLAAALRLFHKKPIEAEALLREVQAVGQQAMTDVSHSVATLRADPLNGQPLYLSILSLVEQFKLSTGVMPRCQWVQGEDSGPIARTSPNPIESFQLSNTQKMTVYRIIQESLTNIRKYAQATKIEIKIEKIMNHDGEYLSIQVLDNGHGFDPTASTTGFGLQGMQERLVALSGYLEIKSVPNQGCQILASFPIVHPLSSFSP